MEVEAELGFRAIRTYACTHHTCVRQVGGVGWKRAPPRLIECAPRSRVHARVQGRGGRARLQRAALPPRARAKVCVCCGCVVVRVRAQECMRACAACGCRPVTRRHVVRTLCEVLTRLPPPHPHTTPPAFTSVYDLAIDPRGEVAVTVGQDGLRVFELASGRLLRVLPQASGCGAWRVGGWCGNCSSVAQEAMPRRPCPGGQGGAWRCAWPILLLHMPTGCGG